MAEMVDCIAANNGGRRRVEMLNASAKRLARDAVPLDEYRLRRAA